MDLLIGIEGAYNTNTFTNFLISTRFACLETGILKELRVYGGSVSGNIKAGIRSDNSDLPGVLLSVNNTGTAITTGAWSSISITDQWVYAGTNYWLEFIIDTTGCMRQYGTTFGYVNYFLSYNYALGIPTTHPLGGSSQTDWLYSIVGYGDPIHVNCMPMLGL